MTVAIPPEVGPELAAFARQLPFPLDPFQVEACRALENGSGVLVCAPTGAGKTIVGEFGVHLALAAGSKCFYTTPIKALSNQKYGDLVRRYGSDSVGLLTGDTSINADAPVVVMTTEVLRNMLYAGSSTLRGLSHVVMDEVHFLADRFRGAVWEEVILHLPSRVSLISLSATVSNAEEFGAWIQTVRGDTEVIVDDTRPVPLWQHMLVGRRLFDLFAGPDNPAATSSPAAGRRGRGKGAHRDTPRVDPQLDRAIAQRLVADEEGNRGGRGRSGGGRHRRRVSRPDMLTLLDADGLLPAIDFIFSRAGCDAAVAQCLRSPLVLTPPDVRHRVEEIIDRHTSGIPRADLEVLGFWEWREGVLRGFAAHHAGLLPAFRHTVEELFAAGLIRAVFATETLALGINMPARTVVLERLVKYNGETHAKLTAGEYTQLTGRAGRRGIDIEGHAVVVWEPDISPEDVAGLASTRTFPLRSSFRASYNMTVNLVEHMGVADARAVLDRSFAQFQADRSVVGLVRGADRNDIAIAELREELVEIDADVLEYAALLDRLTGRERDLERSGRAHRREEAARALSDLRRGDVIGIPSGRRAGLAVIVEPDGSADPHPVVITIGHWAGRISVADVPVAAEVLGRIRLPKQVQFRNPRVRRDIASTIRNTGIVPPGRPRRRGSTAADDSEIAALRRAIRSHPVHDRPDRDTIIRAAQRYSTLVEETASMRRKAAATTDSLSRTFDRIVELLTERGFLSGEDTPGGPRTTADGRMLAGIYSESDLLIAECLRAGIWRGLEPADLAAIASAVLYEARTEGIATTGPISEELSGSLAETTRIWQELRRDEVRLRLPTTRPPDVGFVAAISAWARRRPLDEVLAAGAGEGSLSGGDFVRWCRQVIDLLEQLRNTSDDADLSAAATDAIGAIRRGIVAVDSA